MDPITQGFFFRAEPKLEIWSLIRGYSLINIYWYFLLCGKYSCDPLWCRIHTSRIYIVLCFRRGENIFVFQGGGGNEEKCVKGKGDIKMPFSRCGKTRWGRGGERARCRETERREEKEPVKAARRRIDSPVLFHMLLR